MYYGNRIGIIISTLANLGSLMITMLDSSIIIKVSIINYILIEVVRCIEFKRKEMGLKLTCFVYSTSQPVCYSVCACV